MPRDERLKGIRALEKERKSRILALVLGDRPQLETRIAPDMLHLAAAHLRKIGKQQKIDLFLYSAGGDVMAGFRLVSLIREYCEKFTVLVPFKCQSTATLIALGADEILMVPEGQLSPVDPSINGPYNPMIPGLPHQPGSPPPVLPVSVEEVVAYMSMAREIGDIRGETGLVSVFERLTNDVRPMALGQVYRARTQIRQLSKKLLSLQLGVPKDSEQIAGIVQTLTETLYSHDYLISRQEAAEIGLNVQKPDDSTESLIVGLFNCYVQDLRLFEPYIPGPGLGKQPGQVFQLERAYIESAERVDSFVSERAILQASTPQGPQLVEQIVVDKWVTQ